MLQTHERILNGEKKKFGFLWRMLASMRRTSGCLLQPRAQTETPRLPSNTAYFISPAGMMAFLYILVGETLLLIKNMTFSRIAEIIST